MTIERDYKRRLAAYIGPGGPTCPCCGASTRALRVKTMRGAKRSERQRAKREALSEVAMIGQTTPADIDGGAYDPGDQWLIDQGKHHTDWWAWWLNGADIENARCFEPALREDWG